MGCVGVGVGFFCLDCCLPLICIPKNARTGPNVLRQPRNPTGERCPSLADSRNAFSGTMELLIYNDDGGDNSDTTTSTNNVK